MHDLTYRYIPLNCFPSTLYMNGDCCLWSNFYNNYCILQVNINLKPVYFSLLFVCFKVHNSSYLIAMS